MLHAAAISGSRKQVLRILFSTCLRLVGSVDCIIKFHVCRERENAARWPAPARLRLSHGACLGDAGHEKWRKHV
jgi:hypothetical protein